MKRKPIDTVWLHVYTHSKSPEPFATVSFLRGDRVRKSSQRPTRATIGRVQRAQVAIMQRKASGEVTECSSN